MIEDKICDLVGCRCPAPPPALCAARELSPALRVHARMPGCVCTPVTVRMHVRTLRGFCSKTFTEHREMMGQFKTCVHILNCLSWKLFPADVSV